MLMDRTVFLNFASVPFITRKKMGFAVGIGRTMRDQSKI